MIVGEVMAKNAITIKKSDTLEKALTTMAKNCIRHLPVMEKQQILGIITESDIRGAFLSEHKVSKDGKATDLDPKKAKVSSFMTKELMIVSPETNIEDAALTLYRNKIGALPVMADGKLVGIISIMDMLGLFVDMMGMLHSSSRVDVVMNKSPKNFEKVSGIIHDEGLNIISVGLMPYEGNHDKQIYYFRLDLCETKKVVQKIKKAGFNVVSAIN